MSAVRPKKELGQHFLTDNSIAARIAGVLSPELSSTILEVGPGTGVLTRHLLGSGELAVIEIDRESIVYLGENFPGLRIIEGDFLRYDLSAHSPAPFAIIGNFPYNISSQIFFKAFYEKDSITQLAGMIQKEVAQRIASGPGSKVYGILSVLLRVYYDIEYLFSVPPSVFYPPPKVESAVVRLTRNSSTGPGCSEKLLVKIVKATFNQRRKMIRNSIRSAFSLGDAVHPLFTQRPEQLSLEEFVELTNWVEEIINN